MNHSLRLSLVRGHSLAAGADNAVLAALILPDGVVHLDIKPENVMIAADCSPRIVDLGIAKRLYDSKGKEIVYGGNSLKHG